MEGDPLKMVVNWGTKLRRIVIVLKKEPERFANFSFASIVVVCLYAFIFELRFSF